MVISADTVPETEASDKTSFLRQTPLFSVFTHKSWHGLKTKPSSYHPDSQHGLRATGKMFLWIQVLSYSKIGSISKHTQARWENFNKSFTIPSVCEAIPKEPRKIPHLREDTVVSSIWGCF